MTKILLTVILLVWPLGQLALLPTLNGLRWTALDLLSALLWVSLLISARKKLIADPLFRPLAIFSGAITVSLLVNVLALDPRQMLIASSYIFRFVSLLSIYFGFRVTKIDRRLLILSASAFVLFGLTQYLLWPDTRVLKNLGFDDHYFRLIGTLFDPNYTGLILTQLTFCVYFLFPGRYKALSLLPLIGLSLTFSRASYLAFTLALTYLFVRSKGSHLSKYLPVYLAILIALMWIIPKPFGEGVNLLRTASISSRLVNQQQAWEYFLQRPLFGWGFNTFKQINPVIQNRVGGFDNSFLYILATTGLVGFSAFLYLLLRIWKMIRANPLLSAILLSALIHSLANNSFFYLWESVFFWAALGYLKAKKSP